MRRGFPSFHKISLLMFIAFLSFLGLWKVHRDHYVWTALGEKQNDEFGQRVAFAGYLRGDGHPSVAVWAGAHGDCAEKVYVYYGSDNGLSNTSAWAVQGEAKNNQFGHSMGSVGDVSGKGYDDLIIGAPFHHEGGLQLRKVYLFYGNPSGQLTPIHTFGGKERAGRENRPLPGRKNENNIRWWAVAFPGCFQWMEYAPIQRPRVSRYPEKFFSIRGHSKWRSDNCLTDG